MSDSRFKDLTGKRFGRLIALKEAKERKDKRVVWRCLCECGNHVNVKRVYLTTGQTKSCGCLKKEQNKVNFRDKYNEQYIKGVNTSLLKSKMRNDNKSGVKGVSQHGATGKWDAYIGVNGVQINLGRYKNKEEAIKARKLAEEKFHKPYLEDKNEQQRNKKMD